MEIIRAIADLIVAALCVVVYLHNRSLQVDKARGMEREHAERRLSTIRQEHLDATYGRMADMEKHLAETLARNDRLVDQVVAFKKDGYVGRPPQAATMKEDLFAGMPQEIQTLIAHYPAEFRSTTLRWIKEQRSHGAEWETIQAHMEGRGQGFRRVSGDQPTT